MKFRTELQTGKSPLVLDPRRPVALVGSCFAHNVAEKMQESGWEVFCSAGTLYNPFSIAKVLSMLLIEDEWEETLRRSLFDADGIVHSWLFDSHFSSPDAERCVDAVKEMRHSLRQTLADAQALIVTFGTAWCYVLESKPDYVVANCHKQHPASFIRKRITVSEISEEWCRLIELLRRCYPSLTVIFTVSPVRHLKDGFEGNSRSKATLLLAAEEICEKCRDTYYFPSYEIVCDDLRDYRFYASDLVHPSDFAVEYIWEKFRQTYVDDTGEKMLGTWRKERMQRLHRPIIRKDSGS